MRRPIYSFDDHHIGVLSDTGQALATRDIPKPIGVGREAWYQHAGNVVSLLNKLTVKEDANAD